MTAGICVECDRRASEHCSGCDERLCVVCYRVYPHDGFDEDEDEDAGQVAAPGKTTSAARTWLALRAMDLWLLTGWHWLFLLAVRLLPGDWCGDYEGSAGEEEPF